MLLGNTFDGWPKCGKIVDVRGVRPNSMRQRLRLSTGSLIRVVEEIPELGVIFKEAVIEPCHHSHSVLAENRRARLDDLGLLWGQGHCGSPVHALPLAIGVAVSQLNCARRPMRKRVPRIRARTTLRLYLRRRQSVDALVGAHRVCHIQGPGVPIVEVNDPRLGLATIARYRRGAEDIHSVRRCYDPMWQHLDALRSEAGRVFLAKQAQVSFGPSRF
ncbi:hypothetical protein AWB67_06598 [Caballeronia terrestris]|uniref:Uncharacterized protein n=1 Tax=Caballeronia terrestris TaxID=1226301 RepID=A0A158KTS1_9BURK|nr:hypothetical protein AWB67_06598 [Caballeronia terrestris]